MAVHGRFDDVFKDRTILVTGHTGFKGSWLSIWLSELGAKVIGYALDPRTERDNFVVTGLSDRMVDIRGDIRDFPKLLSVFQQYQPEFIFHLAAQPLVRRSYVEPRETYEVNVMGTVNVLEAIRQTDSVRTAINITSDKCYENKEWVWGYRESDPLGGSDPYSSSKGCAELVNSAYTRSYFNKTSQTGRVVGLASVRAGNVIGGGDWAEDRLVPDCIRALEEGKEIQVRNPEAVRPWQHVLEPLGGYLLLASKLDQEPSTFSGPWNFGPDGSQIVKVGQLVKRIVDHWGQGSWRDVSKPDEPHESKLLSLDIAKAKHQLGWAPELSIERAIEMTVEWYRVDARSYAYNVGQIEEYLA